MIQNEGQKEQDQGEPETEKAGECLVLNAPKHAPDTIAPEPARVNGAPAQGLPGGEGVANPGAPCSVYMGSDERDFVPKDAPSKASKKKSKAPDPQAAAEPAEVSPRAAPVAGEARAAWLDGGAVAAALLGCVTFEGARRPLAHAPKAVHTLCRQHLAEGAEYFETGTQLWVSPEGVRRLATVLNTPDETLNAALGSRAVVELRVVKLHPNPQRLQAKRATDDAIVTVRVREAGKYRVGNPIYARAVNDTLYDEARGNPNLLRRLASLS